MKSLVGNGKMIGNWKSWLSRWPKYKQRGHYRPGFNYDMGQLAESAPHYSSAPTR
jgi:hypothetical protein